MGELCPRICISTPSTTKSARKFQKKKPQINPNIVSRMYATGDEK
jgi:hypothetical protein